MNATRFGIMVLLVSASLSYARTHVTIYHYQDETAYGWKGARSAVLLPVQNESSHKDAALTLKATSIMKQALLHSRRFELVAIHQHNPAIVRALNDKLLNQDQVTSAVEDPKLETVLPVAAAVGVRYVIEVSVQQYKPATETTPLEVDLHGTLYDAATGDALPLPTDEPAWGQSLSDPRKTDAKRLETEALSIASDRLIGIFLGRPLPARPQPPKPKPAPKPVAAAPAAPTGATAPASPVQPQTKKQPVGMDVHLPIEWLYYLLAATGVAVVW